MGIVGIDEPQVICNHDSEAAKEREGRDERALNISRRVCGEGIGQVVECRGLSPLLEKPAAMPGVQRPAFPRLRMPLHHLEQALLQVAIAGVLGNPYLAAAQLFAAPDDVIQEVVTVW